MGVLLELWLLRICGDPPFFSINALQNSKGIRLSTNRRPTAKQQTHTFVKGSDWETILSLILFEFSFFIVIPKSCTWIQWQWNETRFPLKTCMMLCYHIPYKRTILTPIFFPRLIVISNDTNFFFALLIVISNVVEGDVLIQFLVASHITKKKPSSPFSTNCWGHSSLRICVLRQGEFIVVVFFERIII